MTNKTTRKALLTSCMSMLLCVSMLIGSTFAWFTDSVTSANNIIKAGNLDIEVYYAHPSDVVNGKIADDAWKLMTPQGPVFDNDALWEPGYTQLVYFKIKNVGSLAAKYEFRVDILNEVAGTNIYDETFKLSDKIQTYVNACTSRNLFESHCIYTERDIALNPPGAPNPFYDSLANAADGTLGNDEGANTLKLNHSLTLKPANEWDSELYATLCMWMPTTVGNEANPKTGTTPPQIDLGITVVATQHTYEEDSFGKDYDENAEYPTVVVNTADELQNAINDAADGDVIALGDDIKGNLEIPQAPGVEVVIDGNGKTIEGGITLDGKSGTYTTAGAVIQNVNFKVEGKADLGGADACIRLGDGTNATRYTCNVTVRNCTFDLGGEVVGIKSYTGGDKNLTISNCTTTARTHSLAQLKGVDGVLVEGCTVKSVRGINFNNSNNISVVNSTFDVQKYAVRFGSDANDTAETYAISNCTLSSKNEDNDPVIEFRAGAMTGSTLTLTNTTINGNIKMTGHENVTIIEN